MLANLNLDRDELPTTGSIAEALGVSRDRLCYIASKLGVEGKRAGGTRVFSPREVRLLLSELQRMEAGR